MSDDLARLAAGLTKAQREAGWRSMWSAPEDGTEIQAEIPGHGCDNVIAWDDGLLDGDGDPCGGWHFTREQEPPECWTDGYCWMSNGDGEMSVYPTRWKPLPEGASR